MSKSPKTVREAALEQENARLRDLLFAAGASVPDLLPAAAKMARVPEHALAGDGVDLDAGPDAGVDPPRRSPARYRQILESAVDFAIVAMDLDGRITNWNEGARRILGWTEAEVVGKPVHRLFTPDDVAAGRVETEMRRSLEQGFSPDERWHMRKDGQRFWASGEMQPLVADAGHAIGFIKIMRDRTDRYHLERAQQVSFERFRAGIEARREGVGPLFRAIDAAVTPLGPLESWPQPLRTLVDVMLGSNQPMFVVWGAERILLYNDRYVPLLGKKHPGALGRPFNEAWSEILDDIAPIMDRAYAGESVSMDDIALMTDRNGYPEEVHFAFSYTPVRDGSGEIAGVFCACAETTEKVRAEAALRRSEERWRGLFERMQEGFFLAEAVRDDTRRMTDFRFLEINPAFERQTGLAASTTVGRTVREAIPGIQEDLIRRYAEVMASGEPATFEIHVPALADRWYEARARKEGPERFAVLFLDITERKASQNALAASEALLRRAQEAGHIGTFEIDVLRSEMRGSDQFWRLYGLEPHAVAPTSIVEERVHPADRHQASTREGRLSGHDATAAEYRILRHDTGEERWIARTADYVRNAEGRPVQMIGTAQDITERRRATDELRRSEELLRGFMEAIPNQVWTGPPDGKLDWFNEQVYLYSGAVPGELDGNEWARIVHPDDLPAAAEKWAAAIENKAVYETEFRLRRHDGAFRWHLARAVPLRDRDGAVERWIGTNTDIHEQKSIAAELALLNRTLETRVEERTLERDRIWNLSRDPFLIAAADGRWLSISPVWTELLGWSEAELIGRTSAWMEHPDDRDSTRTEVAQLAAGQTTLRFENRFRTKAGAYRWFSWTGVSQGGHLYCVARDVTTDKARQSELEHAQEALRQAQKMEAVGQLTGGIAHDFNNLLTGITGSLDLMSKRIAQGRVGDVERYIRAAMTSANRAAALTHRLLAFARRQPLDPKATDSNRLIGSVEELLRRTLGETIALDIVLAGDLWLTLCDPHQLENALLNLAINARDAMPEGGRLTVETCNFALGTAYAERTPDLAPGQYICISVTDTGAGMSSDVIARAFEPFFTTKPIGQGTGLGLSMIYGFARQSEGQVRIYSEVGQGTCVKLYLPRFGGAVSDEPDTAAAVQAQRAIIGETVLVVEDEPAVRELVVEVLSDLGYRALQASDGPSGLQILQSSERIDLLVTDVGLPGMNGRQLADQGRDGRPTLKVLFITGYAENAMFGSGHLGAGMQMITKPFAVDALAARIRDIIEAK